MAFNMKVTPEIEQLTDVCLEHSKMDPSLYSKYEVKTWTARCEWCRSPGGSDSDFQYYRL